MKIKYQSVFLCILFLFLININTVGATTSPIVLVQNKVDISEDYPVVDEIELRILGNSYRKEDIYNRLGRLETKVFGSVSNKNLSDRVDALSRAVIGANNNTEEDDNYSYHSTPESSYSESYSESSPSSGDASLNNLLNQLEKQLLNQVYPNDTTETRVSRLERFIFNASSDNYSMNERVERLATVIKAQPTNEIYQDVGILNNSQLAGKGLSLAAIILMIVAGLIL